MKIIEYIKNLPKHELEDIKKNGPNPLEIVCRNCGSKYLIDVNKLQFLLDFVFF